MVLPQGAAWLLKGATRLMQGAAIWFSEQQGVETKKKKIVGNYNQIYEKKT